MDRPDRLTLEGIEPTLPARFYLDVDHYAGELRELSLEHGVLVKHEYWGARFQKWVMERLDGTS